jgi:hypothetical protein
VLSRNRGGHATTDKKTKTIDTSGRLFSLSLKKIDGQLVDESGTHYEPSRGVV